MKKTINQLKSEKMYFLRIFKLFDGREKPEDVVVCKQYLKELEIIIKELEQIETEQIET